MTFIAWLPSEVKEPLEVGVKDLTTHKPKKYSYDPALDVIMHLLSQSHNLSLSEFHYLLSYIHELDMNESDKLTTVVVLPRNRRLQPRTLLARRRRRPSNPRLLR